MNNRLNFNNYNSPDDFFRAYQDMKRSENFKKLITAILIILIVFLAFCIRNFVRDVKKFGLENQGFRSTAILILTNIVLYSISAAKNNYDIFLIGCACTIGIFCLYWHVVLDTKNKSYNATIWQENQYWYQFDGWEFEKEVAQLFRDCGYSAMVTSGSNDGGVDIILSKNGVKSIVQCKHHQNPVSIEPIRALWGCMQDFSASEAIFIASSGYTKGCYDFVENKSNYKLMTLDDLSLIAAELKGEMNKIQKKDNEAFCNNVAKAIIPLYLLICTIILICLYSSHDNYLRAKPIAPPQQTTQQQTIQQQTIQEETLNNTEEKQPDQINNPVSELENNDTQKEEIKNKDVNNVDFAPYMYELQRRIKMNWNPPKGDESKHIVTVFKIAKDGRLLDVHIKQSSGSTIADNAAIEAIRYTAPFKPLPSEYQHDSVDIEFTFDYNVFNKKP